MRRAHTSNVKSHHLLPRLKRMDRWICWREEQDGDRMAKVPVDIDPDRDRAYRVSYRKPDHWYTYQEAVELVQSYDSIDGLQIVVNDSRDPFVIVDFDNCIDPETKEIDPAARKYLKQTDTYAELSPSGTGFHLIFQGQVPRQGWSAETDAIDLEVYEKYIVTVTEEHLVGTPYEAKQDDGTLEQIFEENEIWWRERLYKTQDVDDQLGTPGVR